MEKPHLKRKDLVYPDFHYVIAGVLFEVFRAMGPGFKENYYQKAVAEALKSHTINFSQQVPVPLLFKGKKVGINFLDFLIEGKIILELKKGDYFNRQTIEQVNQYLKVTGLKLGLIAVFTSKGVRIKRIINIE
ncbi:MAG: GxxExxY protein [bacterium]|nr:GxxExxY protein [bacterium]